MVDLVFFYGTLMSRFERRQRAGIDDRLTYRGRGSIEAALFDLGIYPAAVPSTDGGRVWGEMFRMRDPGAVLAVLDAIEGCEPTDPDRSLYNRAVTGVRLEDGSTEQAWVYFYNAPLGQAARIDSGDYLRYVTVR